METSKITSVRAAIPLATNPESPLVVTISLPLPVIKSIEIGWATPTAALANQLLTGWRMSAGMGLLIPSQGSYDALTNPGYVSFQYPGGVNRIEDLNMILYGPPYQLTFEFYNTGSAISHAYFLIQSTPLVELPAAPVAADQKKND